MYQHAEYPNESYASEMLSEPSSASFNSFTNQSEELGTVKEYTPVGDGVHMMPQELSLLPLIDHVRPRPRTLVRKVTVVGSHVLRYISQSNNLVMRRYVRQNIRLPRHDQPMSYDQERTEGLNKVQQKSGSGLLQIHAGPSPIQKTMQYLKWRLCFGMMCIIVTQALLSLHKLFKMNWATICGHIALLTIFPIQYKPNRLEINKPLQFKKLYSIYFVMHEMKIIATLAPWRLQIMYIYKWVSSTQG